VPSPLVCQVRRRLPVALVSLYGTLDETSVVDAVVSLRDCLADQPTALVVDASHLAVTDIAALLPLTVLADDAGRWPGAPITLCAGAALTRAVADRPARTGKLVLCDDADAAADKELRRPVPPRVDLNVLPGPDAPAICRELVGRACERWGIPRVRRLAELIISELASNAVLHARTPAAVTVRLAGDCLQMAVRDGDPRLVYRPPPGAHGAHHGEHGRGLLILEAMADTWGSAPTANGKVVWAQVQIPRSRPAPPLR
jgi:anti-sigma regulatory factor (Ser/Thr protein kinase)